MGNGGIIKSSTVLTTDYLIYDTEYGTNTTKYKRAMELNGRGKNIQLIPNIDFIAQIRQEKSGRDENTLRGMLKGIWEAKATFRKSLSLLLGSDDPSCLSCSMQEMSFDDACSRGLIRFELPQIQDDTVLPKCFLVVTQTFEEKSTVTFVIYVSHSVNNLDHFKVRSIEIAKCINGVVNGQEFSGMGRLDFMNDYSNLVSADLSVECLTYSINNDLFHKEPVLNVFDGYEKDNETILNRLLENPDQNILKELNQESLTAENAIKEGYVTFWDYLETDPGAKLPAWIIVTSKHAIETSYSVAAFFNKGIIPEDRREALIRSVDSYISDRLNGLKLPLSGNVLSLHLDSYAEAHAAKDISDKICCIILYFNVVSDETFQAENKRRSHEKDLRFFVPQKVFVWLSQKDKSYDISDLKTIHFEEVSDFSMDVIEKPLHCEVHCSDQSASVNLYLRSNIPHQYSEDEPDLGITFHEDGTTDGKNRGRIGGDSARLFTMIVLAMGQLKRSIKNEKLQERFADFNNEKEGVSVSVLGDDITFTRVSGKHRPALACTGLFGAIEMQRPYFDETSALWESQMQTANEKHLDDKDAEPETPPVNQDEQNAKKIIDDLAKQIDEEKKKQQECESKSEKLSERINSYVDENAQLGQEKDSLLAESAARKNNLTELEQKLDQAEVQQRELTKKLKSLFLFAKKRNQLTEELNAVNSNIANLEKNIKDLKNAIENTEDAENTRLKEIDQKMTSLSNAVQQVSEQFSSQKAQDERLERKISKLDIVYKTYMRQYESGSYKEIVEAEEQKKQAEEAARQAEKMHGPMLERILSELAASDEGLTISQIVRALGNEYSYQQISKYCKELYDLGEVSKTYKNRVAVFELE